MKKLFTLKIVQKKIPTRELVFKTYFVLSNCWVVVSVEENFLPIPRFEPNDLPTKRPNKRLRCRLDHRLLGK